LDGTGEPILGMMARVDRNGALNIGVGKSWKIEMGVG